MMKGVFMLKKRVICTVLSLLMLLVLLPAIDTAKADTACITELSLSASENFKTPKAGDPISFPSGLVSITGTTPSGLASKLAISYEWFDITHQESYFPDWSAGHFLSGAWYLHLFIETTDDSVAFDDPRINGSSGRFTLGGKEFVKAYSTSNMIDYYAEFTIDPCGPDTAPYFGTQSIHFGGYLNESLNCQLNVEGTDPITCSVKSGSLPSGISLSSDGLLSGTYTAGGSFSCVIMASNAYGSDTMECAFEIDDTTKRITSFTLAANGNFEMPAPGAPVSYPTGLISITGTDPAGLESKLGIRYMWFDVTNQDSYYEGSGTGTFCPGYWYLHMIIHTTDDDTVLDYTSPAFQDDGELYRFTLGGKEFKKTHMGSSTIDYYASFEVTEPSEFDGTVAFDPADVQFKGATPYVVYSGTAATPGVIVKDKDGNVIDPSKYTVAYLENAQPGTGYAEITIKATGTKSRAFFKIYMPQTTSTTVANADGGIQISWSAVDGAAGYVIYRRAWNLVSAGWTTFERWNNTTEATWIDTKVYAGTRYQYGVKAYFAQRTDPVSGALIGGAMDNYNLGTVGPLKTTVRITTRALNSVTAGTKQFTAKWSGSSVFTGYQLQYATNASFTDKKTVTISNPKTYQKTVKNLKSNTTYYVRVRSYHVFDGTTYYGGWSSVKSVKTK